MGLSIWHILVVLIVVLIVFGAGRLPHVMGDLGKGIRNFKAGLNGDTPESDKPEQSRLREAQSSRDQQKLPPSDKNDTPQA